MMNKYDRLADRPILKDKDRRQIAAILAKRYSIGVYVIIDSEKVQVKDGEVFTRLFDATASAGEYGKNYEVFRLSTEDGEPTLRDIPMGG